MEITRYTGILTVEDAVQNNEPLMAVISFDRSSAVVSHMDEAVEHHVLLAKAGRPSTDIDKYFRIIFDKSGADWTFVCPPNYKNITDKRRRIGRFYNDGFNAISRTLEIIGYFIGLNIPTRYRRHINELRDDN